MNDLHFTPSASPNPANGKNAAQHAPVTSGVKHFDTEDISNALNIGLCAVNTAGKVLLWNDWIAKHSGIEEAAALNQPLEQVFTEAISPAFLSALKNSLAHKLPVVLSTALHRTPLPLYHEFELGLQQPRM